MRLGAFGPHIDFSTGKLAGYAMESVGWSKGYYI